jgi:subtilase family serine protease
VSVTKSRRPNLYAAGLIAASLLVCGPNTATGQVDLAIDNAVAWLLENQNPNGSFGDAETLKARDSAASVLALLDSGYNSSELTNGLIFVSGVPDASVQFRAQRTQALAHAGQSVAEALDSLLELQNGSGYGAFSAHESNLFDTVLAIQALSLEEQARLLEILPLLDYLLLYQNPDGGWGFVDGAESNTYFTAEAVLALAVLETLEIAPEVLAGAVDYLVTQQLPDGGFGSNLETALVYRALLALGYDITALPVSPVINLLAGQAPDGSWEQDLFTTSNAVLALSRELPNLTITDLQATPGNVTKGDAVTVEVTVANVGPSASPPSYLALRAGAPDGTDEREELTIVGLAPGESIARSAEMATDQDEGELMLFAVADSRGDIEEISENDNDKRIRIGILTEPDLALFPSDVSPSPALPAPNTDFSLLVNVRNLGETTVTSFPFRISRLVDGSPVEVLAEGLGGPASPGTGALVSGTLNLQEGEHLVLVELDPENVVAESAEDNNIVEARIVVFEENLPDLAISEADLIVTPPQPSPGETVSIEITVRNQGVAEATATLAVFDGAPEGGGAEIYSTSLTIAPSGAQTVSTSYLVGPETSLVTAVIDAAELIVEIDEGNNRARRILVDRPDLSIGVDNLELVPTDPLEGDPVQVVLTVRNAGTAEATDVPIEVFEGEPGLGGTSVFSEEVPFISPGGNRVLSFSWSAARGLTTMVVVADPNDLIEEFSETNNRVEREVAASRSTGPDLVVAELDLAGFDQSPLSLVATGILTVDVLNQGDEEIANSFGVRVFEDRNGDGRFSSGDQELASSVVAGPLGIGESLAAQLDIDAVLAFHRPLIWVEADHTGAVDEAREDNNRRAVFGSCEIPTQPSLEVVEEWYLPGVEVESTPVVAQLSDDNGDGLVDSRDYPDVAFHTEDDGGSAITARSGIDGSELWTFRSSADHPLATRVAHLAAADLDGNGISEIIGVQSNSRLIALDHKGAVHWVSDTIESTAGDLWAGGIAVGDLSGDGVPEVAVGRSVLSNTGALIAVGTGNAGRNYNFYGPFGVPFLIDAPLSVIADVDLDGQAELVAGDTLYRLVNDSLTIVWDKVEPDDLMVDGYVAVANLDSDPKGEIVYVSSNRIMVLNHDGSVLRPDRNIVPFSPFTDPTFWGGPPTVAELDGTAPPEILVSAYRELVAFRSDLSVLWRKPTSDQSEQSAAAGFDFDGDGSAEVLYADETHFYILEGATGDTLYSTPNLSKTATEYPVVADVDGDGRAEILVPSNRAFDGDDSTQGLHVLGNPTWSKTRPVWNQHSYHVTNVQLDGTVPESEVPSWSVLNSFRANQSLAADVQRLPNLTLGAPRTGPATAEGIPVTVRVGNGGLSLVPPGVELQLFEGDPGASPPVGLAETSSPLAPGAWEDVEINWQAPGLGPRPATAVVDPSDSYQECDEGDNTVAFEVDEQLLSDLTIPAGGVSLGVEPTAGQLIPIDIEVGNIGSAIASQVVVTLFDGEPLLGKPLGTTIIDLVNVGESAFAEIMWDSLGFTGLHMIHAASDPDDLILELNETNNEGLVSVALEPPTKPDLAVESFEVVPNPTSAGQLVLLTSDVANRGLDLDGGFDVVFRLNHAEVGRVLVPDRFEAGASRRVELQLATSGLTGVYVVEVELDPDYLLDEENETNNLATEVLQIGSSDLSLVVTTDRPNYGANDIVAVGANGISSATAERAATLVVSILDSFDSEVALLTEESVDLQPGENTFSFVWDTGAMPPGAYQAVGQLRDGEVLLAAGTALFSIGADVGVVASLLADRETYLPTQSAILTASVRNTSANNNLVDLGLQVSVRDPGGQLIFGSEEDIQLLPAGDIRSVDFTFFIDNEPPGSYTAVLAVSDSGGQTLTTAGSQLVVEDSADTGAGLRGSLNGFPDLVGRGGPIQVDLELTNAGNTHLPNLEVRLDVMRLADGALASFLQFPAPLDLGETLNRSVGLSTNDLDEGDYLINLVGLLDGVEKDLDGAPITVARGVSVADEEIQEGDSGTAAIEFTATLSSPSDVPVTVEFATADGTALAGVDYQETIGPLSFPPGVTAMSFTVPVFGDLDGELDETFQLILQNASGAQIADGNAIGTIRDEEGCPSPNLIVNGDAEESDFENPTAGWSEVDSAGWRQRFSAPSALSGLASFTFGGLDAAAELQQPIDLGAYAALTDTGAQEFAFSAFLSSSAESPPDTGRVIIEFLDASKLVVLDFFDSGDITSDSGWTAVSANVFAPTGTRWAVVRLLATRGAGDVASFGLQLTCPATGAVEIDFQTGDGTAEGGNDYLPSSGTVHLDPGETSGVIEVEVLGDSIDEEDEDFLVTITAANGVVVLDEEGKARILDDDGEPVLSISDGAAVEGDWDSTDLEFVVLLSPPSGKVVTVDYATAAGTALPDDDFLTASGTLTFAPGVSAQSVPVSIAGDKVNELEEKFSLILSQSNNATIADGEALGTIIDNDEVEITVDDVSVVEGDEGTTDAVFNVHLSVASDRPVSLDYATADGEAVAPDDYLSQVGLLTFPPQATTSTVAVPVVGEILIEALETFRLVLSNPSVGVLVDDLGIARILDNDAIQIRIEDTAVIEGDDGSIQADLEVSLSRASSQVLTVDYQTNDGSAVAGEDYLAVSDTLIFAPGATSQIVSIPLLGDAIDEPIESFLVVLTGPSEGVIFDAEGEATILDDDGWHLNGSATIETIPACIQLTPTISQQKGSAWRTTLHDLTENFDQTYRVYLGNKDSSGADGIVFTLQNVGPEAIGTGTGNSTALGYWGLAPSVGVELDTWESSSNLDQIAVNENGQMNHSGHPPVPASADSSNIEDGQEHDLRLVWSAASQTLAAYFDESRRLFYSRDIVTDIFGGGPQVFYGFTGGTGGLSNLQYFCPTDLCFGTSENPSISIGDAMAIEGDPNASQAVFPVTLSCPSEQPVHASFATEDGTAVAGEDYLPVSGVMTFLPGETSKSVVVEVVDDPDSEPNEDFSVEISDAIGGDLRYSLATGTIESEDVTARLANTILVEGDLPVQRARLTVELTEPVAETLTLQYASTDGSAIAGSDYDSVSGDLVFAAGQTTKLITIDIRGDLLTEGDEELFIQFSSLEVSSFVDSQTCWPTAAPTTLRCPVASRDGR